MAVIGFEQLEVALNELLSMQASLITSLQDSKTYINDENVKQVHATMIRTQQYYKKLSTLRKDMTDVQTKTSKLKSRAMKLMETQHRSAEARKTALLLQHQQEQKLIAKPANPLSPSVEPESS